MSNRTTGTEGPGHGRFADRYGAWALVAGASEGLGAAFARALAARGMNLVPVARRKALLDGLAEDLRARFGVEVRPVAGDLAAPDFPERLAGSDRGSRSGSGRVQCRMRSRRRLLRRGHVGAHARRRRKRTRSGGADADAHTADGRARTRGRRSHVLARGQPGRASSRCLRGEQGLQQGARRRPLARAQRPGDRRDRLLRRSGAYPGLRERLRLGDSGTLDPEVVAQRALRALGRGPLAIPGFVNLAADFFMSRLRPDARP